MGILLGTSPKRLFVILLCHVYCVYCSLCSIICSKDVSLVVQKMKPVDTDCFFSNIMCLYGSQVPLCFHLIRLPAFTEDSTCSDGNFC